MNAKEAAILEFDSWSRSYDRSLLQRFLFKPSHRAMADQMRGSDLRILDVGCGTGKFASIVLEQLPQAQVFGLDLSEQMLVKGSPRLDQWPGRYHVVRGDSERLPFEEDSFDVVTCSHSFHHYPHQDRVVREMHRVLKPDGRLMLIDGNRDGWWGWLIFDIGVTWVEGQVHHCSGKRLRNLFTQAGFVELEQIRRNRFIPFMLTIGVAEKETMPAVLAKAA
jgi:ubiquinone/menaquinone biosynthesis C-methylase UbiE